MPTKISGNVINCALTGDPPPLHLIGAASPTDRIEIILDSPIGQQRYISVKNPVVRKNGLPGELLDIIGAQQVQLILDDEGLMTEIDIHD